MTQRKEWHLDKTVSVCHLVSTFVIAISVFSWASAVDRRIEQNSQSVAYIKLEKTKLTENIASIRAEFRDEFKQVEDRIDALRLEIKSDLGEIHKKLDRLVGKK